MALQRAVTRFSSSLTCASLPFASSKTSVYSSTFCTKLLVIQACDLLPETQPRDQLGEVCLPVNHLEGLLPFLLEPVQPPQAQEPDQRRQRRGALGNSAKRVVESSGVHGSARLL